MGKNTIDKQYIENEIIKGIKFNKRIIKDNVKNSSGITLITLVITILIIIILAGITINTV